MWHPVPVVSFPFSKTTLLLSFVRIWATAFCLCHTSLPGWYFSHLFDVDDAIYFSQSLPFLFPITRSLHPSVAPAIHPPPTPPASYVSVTKDPFRKYQSASLRGWVEWNPRRSSSGLLSPEYTNIMSTTVNTCTDSLYCCSLGLRSHVAHNVFVCIKASNSQFYF